MDMIFEYTLKNSNGIRHTLVTDKFYEPGSYIIRFGETCVVEEVDVFTGVSCAELKGV